MPVSPSHNHRDRRVVLVSVFLVALSVVACVGPYFAHRLIAALFPMYCFREDLGWTFAHVIEAQGKYFYRSRETTYCPASFAVEVRCDEACQERLKSEGTVLLRWEARHAKLEFLFPSGTKPEDSIRAMDLEALTRSQYSWYTEKLTGPHEGLHLVWIVVSPNHARLLGRYDAY